MSLTTPATYADQLLALCDDALGEETVVPATTSSPARGGRIARKAVVPFGAAFDCEMLAVAVSGLGEAVTEPLTTPLSPGRRTVYGRVNLISFRVYVVRDCVPFLSEHGDAPPISEVKASADEALQDAWAIWNRIYQVKRAIDDGDPTALFNGACSDLFMHAATPLVPFGGFTGWTVDLSCDIDGFVV